MNGFQKAMTIMVSGFFFMTICLYAADVWKARADAERECYKAAQVNADIKCDGASK